MNTHLVYHIHNGTDTSLGYIGVTRHLRNRLYAHAKRFVNCQCDVLLVGTEEQCLRLEATLRPRPNMGWNTAEGGWNKCTGSIGKSTRIKSGQHLSPRTQFVKGQSAHNAGRTQYKLTSPEGVTYIVSNLTVFCREHGLTRENIRKVARGNRTHCKGWKAAFYTGR